MTTLAPAGPASIESNPETLYTPEALADIWVASYHFSQGSTGIQTNMLGFICNEVIPDEVLADQTRLEESFELGLEKAGKIKMSGKHIDIGETSSEIKAIEDDFQANVVDAVMPDERDDSLQIIVDEFLRKDATYMPANGADKRTFASANDRYFSYAARYLLLGKRTRIPAVNFLFAQAQPYLAPAAARNLIRTYEKKSLGDEPTGQVRNIFTFNDVLLAHLKDNPGDIGAIQKALSRLGISQLSGYDAGELIPV
jgi:hypothetical protein